MSYYAHISKNCEPQTVLQHLQGTAALSKQFSVEAFAEIAEALGHIHDIGKYAPAFQAKLQGESNGYAHAAAGAIEIMAQAKEPIQKLLACMMAYCIAGHHAGLQDGGSEHDLPEMPSLYGVLNRRSQYCNDADYCAFRQEISITLPETAVVKQQLLDANRGDMQGMFEAFAFLTRYLFSCLKDADYLDTERYYMPEVERSYDADFEGALQLVQKRLQSFKVETSLQKARSVLQSQAFRAAAQTNGISVLHMPTGSGKTLCSLQIALQKIHASQGRLKRIVYVIPYTSIIEQTAQAFEQLIGDRVTILQHHSNFAFDDDEGDESASDVMQKLKRSAENWDVPLVITTTVQFFESLYHYKGKQLRKLHNLADTVIVLDEVHMLPVKMLQPCLRALGFLTGYLHSEVLLLSATMPDYTPLFSAFSPACPVHTLITDRSDFGAFEKCTYHDLGETDYESIAMQSAQYRSSLIVVNSRAAARTVYSMLNGEKYHLSTYMTAHDRSAVIQNIRAALQAGRQVQVVSTSLIEAGVDLDFEVVFRELAGLDSILQSGGRCNREGRRANGDVYIFRTEGRMQCDLQQRASITKELLEAYPQITAPECITEYYRRLFHFHDAAIESNTIAVKTVFHPREGFVSVPFRSYALDFEMIEADTIGVIINSSEETAKLLERLRYGERSVLRKLQQHTVSLRRHSEFTKVYPNIVSEYEHTGVFVLNDQTCYDTETGLHFESRFDGIFG